LDCKTGELLKGIENLAITTDEVVELSASDSEGGAAILDIDIDIAI